MTGKDQAIRSTVSVHGVSGVMDAKQVQDIIGKACGTESTVIDASSEWIVMRGGKEKNVELTVLQLGLIPHLLVTVLVLLLWTFLCFRWDRSGHSSFLITVRGVATVDILWILTVPDGFLSDIIDRLPSSKKYTLLYMTSPREFDESESVVYKPDDLQNPLRMELKRDYSAHVRGKESSSDSSLFQEYQYLTPGAYP